LKLNNNEEIKMEQDMSVDQVSYQLNVSRVTVYKLMKEGKLSFYKAGKCTRITQESIDILRGVDNKDCDGGCVDGCS